MRSSASSHWSTFEVISHVWHSLKIVSPVNTTRSSGHVDRELARRVAGRPEAVEGVVADARASGRP